jgi:hypothetical protein
MTIFFHEICECKPHNGKLEMQRNETSSTSVGAVCDFLRTSISCFFKILKSKNLWFWFWNTLKKPLVFVEWQGKEQEFYRRLFS